MQQPDPERFALCIGFREEQIRHIPIPEDHIVLIAAGLPIVRYIHPNTLSNRGMIHETMEDITLAQLKKILSDPQQVAELLIGEIIRIAGEQAKNKFDLDFDPNKVASVYLPAPWTFPALELALQEHFKDPTLYLVEV